METPESAVTQGLGDVSIGAQPMIKMGITLVPKKPKMNAESSSDLNAARIHAELLRTQLMLVETEQVILVKLAQLQNSVDALQYCWDQVWYRRAWRKIKELCGI